MRNFVTAGILILGLAAGLAAQSAHPARSSSGQQSQTIAAVDAPVIHRPGVPAHHRVLPKGGVAVLPATMNPKSFNDPRVQAVYAMAAKIRGVLYRQPCYCHCDQEMGHRSLLDCYVGTHASICETCLMEADFAYQQTRKGQSATQIRAEIEHGDWRTINLNSLLTARKY